MKDKSRAPLPAVSLGGLSPFQLDDRFSLSRSIVPRAITAQEFS